LKPLSMVAAALLDLRWGRQLPTFFREKERLEAACAPANLLHPGKPGLYLEGLPSGQPETVVQNISVRPPWSISVKKPNKID